ncbi:MAG: PolC-type DNA polymerase III, partial [Lachnospiraceae bacterium]|nr:PolC-type DNA polymerase III [Lachnospiraceae bacterium]
PQDVVFTSDSGDLNVTYGVDNSQGTDLYYARFRASTAVVVTAEGEDNIVGSLKGLRLSDINDPNDAERYKLDTVAKELGYILEGHHRAVNDAECTADIFLKLSDKAKGKGVNTLAELNEKGKIDEETVKKLHPYHAIILAKNDLGRINLYRLVSISHTKYFSKHPRIPKSELLKHREGLLLGSACEAGELYQAILEGKSDRDIYDIASFYDYLEIQPNGNNAFMLRSDKYGIESEEDLNDINRKILSLADEQGKLCVATCDVHFLNPEDAIYRSIIQAGKGFDDADNQAPLYLHTTEEMLKEFEYLGLERAQEVVITNSCRIADMCEYISPVRPDKAPPVIENSDETLRKICYDKAHAIYGPELPEIVEKRLEKELTSIIGNGYAVMYIIAQKLVWKSVEDGYLVGSRGSVGSSFVATMSGITEVNPLSAHYYCKKCHYYDFDSPEVRKYAGRSGCDMPDKMCPNCGEKLVKEGFDIPFETFLGFKGDKEPDIDLNFSGDYQSKAHKYTEVIFGAGQTLRAGTISGVAEKTAYGYVKKYFEERGIQKRSCEVDRLVPYCSGVKTTTGQHPGGIVVLPVGEEINTFTPVQKPANDMTTDTITTHFDYHAIDHNLLKLDILGHDDPTMIRKLEDLTGIDATKIPLDDPKVMSLFQGTEVLGIKPEDIDGTPLGTLGIPEFGTDFAMNMVVEAAPKEFTDLVCISGLSHGTDVWLGNAQDLIRAGTATISTCISTRDDIMTFLINKGLDPALSFNIMEKVRKGVVAKGKCEQWPEWEQEMLAHDVPQWYCDSCKKIKYMFPKAHAVAYVMMAWRIGYCKIYHPLAYYAAFFSIRSKGFNYQMMCRGRSVLRGYMQEYKARMDDKDKKNALSAAEQDSYKDMRLVDEMYARGFEFVPIDIYKADARYFQIIDGKLMASFNSIEGMGDQAAENLAIAAKQGKFMSLEDIKNRGKVPQKVIDSMVEMGILEGLPQTNQYSLFDFM